MAKVDILPICKDTAEPKDRYRFKGAGWKDRVALVPFCLNHGDYAPEECIDGDGRTMDGGVFVERKTLQDFIGSVGKGRTRYENMWKRATPNTERWLLCEGEDFLQLLFAHEYLGDVSEQSAVGTLLQWAERFHYIPFPVRNSVEGMEVLYRIFWHWRERQRKGLTRAATNHWQYAVQAIDHVLATVAGRCDLIPKRIKRDGEFVQIVPAREFENAVTMLTAARAALKGRGA